MDFNSPNLKKYGKNFGKAKKIYNRELLRAKTESKEKYPFANIDEFEFWVNLNQDGTLNETDIVYKADGKTKLYNITGTLWKWSWNIKSNVFRTKYANVLHWGPPIWEPNGTVQPFLLSTGVLPFNVGLTQFDIFVTKSF